MSNPASTLSQRYFDDVYTANDDPWSFTTSEYERAKYAATLAALPNVRYASAFEIGCSIGVLSALLAPRCEALLAVDVSETPLRAARERLAPFSQVTIRQMSVPAEFPPGPFDLILFSEVGYYFSLPDLERVRELIVNRLTPGGHLILVHWTPFVSDYPLTGDQVHEAFLALAGPGQPLTHLSGQRAETYRLDVFEKR